MNNVILTNVYRFTRGKQSPVPLTSGDDVLYTTEDAAHGEYLTGL